jgi:hypothetical protein
VLFSSNVYLLLVLVLFVLVLVCFCCPVVSLFLELRVVVVVVLVVLLPVQFGLELAPGQGGFEVVVLQCCFQSAECAGNGLAKLDFELQFVGNCNTRCS